MHVLVHGHPKVPPEQMFNPGIRSGVTATKPGAKHCLHDSQFDRLTGQQGASTWGCCLASGCCGGVSVMGQVQLGSNLPIRLNTNTVLCDGGRAVWPCPLLGELLGCFLGKGKLEGEELQQDSMLFCFSGWLKFFCIRSRRSKCRRTKVESE